MSDLCKRWGVELDQCVMPEGHLGPCVTASGPTLPVGYTPPVRERDDCVDCGEPRWAFAEYCIACLISRFGNDDLLEGGRE